MKLCKLLLELHDLKSLNVDGVEQVSRKSRVVAVEFFFDQRIERGGMNLRVKILQLFELISNMPIQYGVAIIGMLGEKWKAFHNVIELIATFIQNSEPLMKIFLRIRCFMGEGIVANSINVRDIWDAQ